MAIGSCTSCSSNNPYTNYIREQQKSFSQPPAQPKAAGQQLPDSGVRTQASASLPVPPGTLDIVT